MGPIVLFRAWPHSEVLQNELDEVYERHLLLARNLAAALERYHRDVVTTFELFAMSDEPWRQSTGNLRLLTNLSIRHLCLVDAETSLVLDTLATVGTPCPEVVHSQTLAMLNSIAEPDVVNFGSVVEAPDGQNVIHLVMPRKDQIVIGSISTDYFRELGEAISFGVMGHAAIVDHTGRALSHPRPDWVEARHDMSQISAVQRMLNRETGVETFYSPALDGDMIAGLTFVDPVGWGVMIPQPIDELYQMADDANRSTQIVLLIGTGLAFLLSLILSIRIVRPVERVTMASQEISNGRLFNLDELEPSRFAPIELTTLQSRFKDMVQRLRENMRTINQLAFVDTVTGLGNRRVMQKCLDKVDACRAEGALLLLDLDGFKSVNDDYGHDIGDDVLRQVGERIKAAVHELASGELELDGLENEIDFDISSVHIARMGGDEFAIWNPSDSQISTEALAQLIIGAISAPFEVGDLRAIIGVSIGTAVFPCDAQNKTTLLKAADVALYKAKSAGRNRHEMVTATLLKTKQAERALATELKIALENGDIIPYYQPQFDLPNLHVTGVEALARWKHPERGVLFPSDFLPLAREMGLLKLLDEVIMDTSVKQMSQLAKRGINIPALSLNLSEERLGHPGLISSVQNLPDAPFEIRFELLETLALDSIEGHVAHALDAIRKLGHRIDLDDFGASNASLLGLLNVDPSHLKIDRMLVAQISNSPIAERLVKTVIEMGHSLGILIISEGVEDLETLQRLIRLGSDTVQGNFLATAMDFESLAAFLAEYEPAHAFTERKVAS